MTKQRHNFTPESKARLIAGVRKGHETCKKLGKAFHDPIVQAENGRKGGQNSPVGRENAELGRGICGLTFEERIKAAKSGGKKGGPKAGRIACAQEWMCLCGCGMVSTPMGIGRHHKYKGIDPNLKMRLS